MPITFPTIVTSVLSESVSPNAQTLTRLLVRFIDPREQSYSREELIERFCYPEDDLPEVDADWIFKNQLSTEKTILR
jgi:hypothetical protein